MRREDLVAELHALRGPARERARQAWTFARRFPDAVLAAALIVGVIVMVLHWS
jgi:hypothetical protein